MTRHAAGPRKHRCAMGPFAKHDIGAHANSLKNNVRAMGVICDGIGKLAKGLHFETVGRDMGKIQN